MKQARRTALTAATVNAMQTHGNYGFLSRVGAIPRMLRDTLRGDYPGLGKGQLFLMLMATLYLVSPIDLLPEAILTLPGMVDDLAIAVWLMAAALGSADEYLAYTDPRPVYAEATINHPVGATAR